MLQSGLPDCPLEQEDLIGKFDRISVTQVDFELSSAFFVYERVDFQTLASEKR